MRSPIVRGLALLLGLALLVVFTFRQQPLVVIQQLSIGGSAADAAVSVATALPALNATAAPTAAPAATPLTLQSNRLLITIDRVDPVAGGVKISGSVKNTSSEELSVPIGAFELYDNAGASFIAGGGAAATLKPGESTPIELTTPIIEGRILTRLVLHLLPDAPVELALPATAPLPGEPLPTVVPTAPYEQAMRPWPRA
jgi:hypothetical protein